MFYRVSTIIAISSIVVTAVYVLRAVAIMLLGPIKDGKYESITDAVWHEKVSIVTLTIAILVIGIVPLWLSDMVFGSLDQIMDKINMTTLMIK